MPPGSVASGYEGSRKDPDVVGFEGRENVRSTLGFLESMRPLGATTSGSVLLKMSGSKLRLPLLLRRAGDSLLLEDCGFWGCAELKLGM